MSFFISDAWAEAAPQAAAPGLGGLIPLLLIGVLFYFLLIRPQAKRVKEHKKMVESLAKGDEIVTSGGVLGRLTKLEDDFVTMEVSDGVEIKVQRNAINSLVPKGTVKGKKD
ncbi:MAG: preprotein translocase subunit YajC [Gammaproteobacteria bacterium]